MTVEMFFANFGHLADAPNGVKKLRELILQLAVQGKLVPQDPNDEPASVLLEKIEAEKESLVKAYSMRKSKNEQQVSTDEHLYSLPKSWNWVRLGELALFENGDRSKNYPNKSALVPTGIPFINAGHLNGSEVLMADMNFISRERFSILRSGKVQQGDILFCLRGSLGKVGLVNGINEGAIASSLVIVRPWNIYMQNYLLSYFQSSLSAMLVRKYDNGTAQPNLSASDLRKFVVPFPPLEEQKRIVTKVNQLMTLCDELETRQKKQQQGRVRLNNAALDKLLTARESDEFDDHWQRISTNFDLLYDHPETIAKLRGAILQLAVQGKLFPHEKPELWREGVLGDVVESSEAGWSPQCENRPCTGKEWGVLKVSSVTWGKFIPGENKTLPRHLEPRPRYAVVKGDFLISRANTAELVARSVVVDRDYPRLMMSDKIIRARFRVEADPNFFNLVNNAPLSREYYARVAGGTSSSMKNVSRKQILELPVIIPPLAEQKRIVAKVDQLMALCDELEIKLNQAQQNSEKLMEATIRQFLAAP